MRSPLFHQLIAWSWTLTLAAFVGASEPAGLTSQLLSADSAEQAAGLKGLQQLEVRQKREILLPLRQALRSNPASAERAARALAQLGGFATPATPELVDALAYDEETVFDAIQAALVGIGPAAVPALNDALNDGNFFVRRRAAQVLAQFGVKSAPAAGTLVHLLQDPQYEVKQAAEATLIKIGDGAVRPVAMQLQSGDDLVRRSALTLLGKLGPSAATHLIGALKRDPSGFVRVSAAEALGQLGSVPSAVAALIEALNDLEENVRGTAADSLGEIGESAKSAAGPLLAMSFADKDALVQVKARDALAKLGALDATAISGLARVLRHPDPAVRGAAIELLGKSKVGIRDAAPVLLSALRDASEAVRLKAVDATGQLGHGSRESVALLRSALVDASAKVKQAALTHLGDCKVAADDAAAAIRTVLKDADATTQRTASEALAKLGVSSSTPSH